MAQAVASELGFHYLDSGALYRIVGLAVSRAGGNLKNELEVLAILLKIKIKFERALVLLDGQDVGEAIRAEPISAAASKVGAPSPPRHWRGRPGPALYAAAAMGMEPAKLSSTSLR